LFEVSFSNSLSICSLFLYISVSCLCSLLIRLICVSTSDSWYCLLINFSFRLCNCCCRRFSSSMIGLLMYLLTYLLTRDLDFTGLIDMACCCHSRTSCDRKWTGRGFCDCFAPAGNLQMSTQPPRDAAAISSALVAMCERHFATSSRSRLPFVPRHTRSSQPKRGDIYMYTVRHKKGIKY